MTEINTENTYKPDQYHWVTPDVETTGTVKNYQPAKTGVESYDCSKPNSEPTIVRISSG